MDSLGRRRIKRGAAFGIVAGLIFLLAEMIATSIHHELGLMPLRLFASIVMGSSALTRTDLGLIFVVGIVVHLALSALFGLAYSFLEARYLYRFDGQPGPQAVAGMIYGALLWIIDFQIIARISYPWFLAAPQAVQLLLHMLAFGLPLGLLFAGLERRSRLWPRTI